VRKRVLPGASPDSTSAFERLLTCRETAGVLGVTDRTLRTLVRTGSLPAVVRFGRSVRFDPADLREFIREREARAEAESVTAL
jgi:excisionase family DNA binding protein